MPHISQIYNLTSMKLQVIQSKYQTVQESLGKLIRRYPVSLD